MPKLNAALVVVMAVTGTIIGVGGVWLCVHFGMNPWLVPLWAAAVMIIGIITYGWWHERSRR